MSGVRSGRAPSRGGVGINYLVAGDDDGRPPIVFVPGVTDVADDYREILGALGRRVAVIDLRGRGRSDVPARGYALDDHVADVASVVAEVTSGPVHLMTFSRGTSYALGWAFTDPGRVWSVAIGDYPAREIALPPGLASRFLEGRWRGSPVTDRIAPEAFRCLVDDAVGREMWEELGQLRIPVLVVRAGAGGPLDAEGCERYRQAVADVEIVTFDDSPHDIFRPDRTRYLELVRRHVERAEQVRIP